MIDLVSERVGGRVVAFNDEFFAAADNLIKSSPPIANDEYTDRGKWMDGWETRRRREPGHDWCVIRLGVPGRIEKVTVDTSHFTGNYPEQFSLDASGVDDLERAEWVEVIPPTDLEGDSVAEFEVDDPHRVDMIRLNIYPDGGVARLRLEGEPLPAVHLVCPDSEVDLAGAAVGGEMIAASDMYFSHPANLLRPGTSAGMWDGWETRRRRDDGFDWATVCLGLAGSVEHVIVDTTHFKGNAPGWVSCEVSDDGEAWRSVVERTPVGADQVNQIEFERPEHAGLLRLSIHPDGGVARLRVMGRADPDSAGNKRLAYLNSLYEQPASDFFTTACRSKAWAGSMLARRPFATVVSVLDAAESVFETLGEEDWLEAFAGHPRIGERGDPVANREQATAADASDAVLAGLELVNREYEDRFGFTYLVYATGRTAEQMLAIARERLGNERSDEVASAAAEQRLITATRLRRMLCQGP